jgi:hypothetical protein
MAKATSPANGVRDILLARAENRKERSKMLLYYSIIGAIGGVVGFFFLKSGNVLRAVFGGGAVTGLFAVFVFSMSPHFRGNLSDLGLVIILGGGMAFVIGGLGAYAVVLATRLLRKIIFKDRNSK